MLTLAMKGSTYRTMNTFHCFLGFWAPGPLEWVVIGIVAVLLFGKRLPEVGRSLGQGIVEFKKGLKGATDELNDAVKKADHKADKDADKDAAASTKPYDDEDKA
jgi:sec-independent protein translocase protein TatA